VGRLDWDIETAELVTISDCSAALWWVTAEPQPTALRFGDHAECGRYLRSADPPTCFHHLEIHGLTPQTTYYYPLSDRSPSPANSSGPANPHSPGTFQTLARPGGQELFRFCAQRRLLCLPGLF
jgi:hypothetical protein